MTKAEKALEACEKVLDGIEENSITTSSALLQCLKISRLLNDYDAIIWLQYEYGGYPRTDDGKHIQSDAWNIAYKNGRGYIDDGNKVIFTEIASELEEKIVAQHKAVNNFSTQGTAISGDYALGAVNNLTSSVTRSTNNIVSNIALNEKRLSILKSRYYDYALKKQIEVSFGNVAAGIFSEYREKVENHFSDLSKDTILKLQAIEDKINSGNPELYSQALATCRRLFENTAKELFDKYFPSYEDKMYKTKSGKDIDVSGDHYKNKLSAVIEKMEDKSTSKSLVGSNIIYLLDWMDNLSNLQCKGVHSDVSRQDAMRCIIQTYICLGDILNLQNEKFIYGNNLATENQ
ncbi:MAG: hypothetical protein K2M46_05460 [Lachnospiraceae bacterium]|nr:hypothetical protein [Lachnospiraceae bacterium]